MLVLSGLPPGACVLVLIGDLHGLLIGPVRVGLVLRRTGGRLLVAAVHERQVVAGRDRRRDRNCRVALVGVVLDRLLLVELLARARAVLVPLALAMLVL